MKDSESIIRQALALPGIESLNPMQRRMAETDAPSVILTAPTGSGKTLAFGMFTARRLVKSSSRIQAVILSPTRELALQSTNTIRAIIPGMRIATLYGGHDMGAESRSVTTATPDIVIATPGRLVDHLQRHNIDIAHAGLLVLDEYDKLLQLGFEKEMRQIVRHMSGLRSVALVSATTIETLPDFIPLKDAVRIADDDALIPQSTTDTYYINSHIPDKAPLLVDILRHLPQDSAIVFVNHRESADRLAEILEREHIPAAVYHGALDQNEREIALALFANGTVRVLIATDLAARGLDIDRVQAVIHYHLPLTPETAVHRNGRTGRYGGHGTIIYMLGPDDILPLEAEHAVHLQLPSESSPLLHPDRASLYLNLGRKDKISKGDVAGYIFANTTLTKEQLGTILLRDHSVIVDVPRASATDILKSLTGTKIKNQRVKVSIINHIRPI